MGADGGQRSERLMSGAGVGTAWGVYNSAVSLLHTYGRRVGGRTVDYAANWDRYCR